MAKIALIAGLSLTGATAFWATRFYEGKASYGPLRSQEWIRREMADLDIVQGLRQNPAFSALSVEKTKSPLTKDILVAPGGLAGPMVFVDRKQPGHAIAIAYCGPRTCGFPFLVHGGILATLIEDVVSSAAQSWNNKQWNNIKVSYRRPTLVGQFLVIETTPAAGGKSLDTTLKSLANKTLVTANATIS